MKTNLLKMAVIIMTLVMTTSLSASRKLCLIGDATRYDWDKGNASPMIQDPTNPSVFYYNAWLKTGDFKFILENTHDSWFPTWNKADDTHIVKRASDSDPDNKFSILTAGNYSITVDTTTLTISIVPMTETAEISFNTVFMLGDATSIGWDITNSIELTKNPGNPFEFSYKGHLNVGEFKFPVNRNSGWGQDFFIKVSDTEMQLLAGGDVKWSIAEAGNYDININTQTLAISIQKQTTTTSRFPNNDAISLNSNVVKSALKVNNLNSVSYKVYNLSGLMVNDGISVGENINVSSLVEGIYILNINNQVFKFIKQ
ncbi:MAG: SusF/SusE family outer membrane protein [Paludibacter sp.]|nr:SusF/SusE family outer membrane protein [Paludibacter sp.]